MTAPHPWWASEGPVDGGIDPAEDPVERFRAARRGQTDAPDGSGRDDPPADDRDGAGAAVSDDEADDPADAPARERPWTDDGASAEGEGGGDGAQGPWWEAAAETVSRLARDLAETAEAHQPPPGSGSEAAGSDADPDEGSDVGSGADPDAGSATGPSREREPAGEDAAGPPPHDVDVCGVCPICVGLRTLGESRPELVGHLAEAARHVALAARSLGARSSSASPGDEPLQRIDLDD